MSETIELVEQARAEGNSVKKACKLAGISVPHYYANRHKLNGSRPRQRRATPEPQAADGRYLAILDALRNLHMGDIASARKALADALLM
jgi:hypothetical protein